MKNILNTLPLRSGKFNLLADDRKKSKVKDKIIANKASLDQFQSCYENVKSHKTVYDCNSNRVVSSSSPSTFSSLKRAKSLTRNLSSKFQGISNEIRSRSFIVGEVDSEYIGQQLSSLQEVVEHATRRSSRKLKKHLRTVSDNINTLTRSKSVEEIIDFGKCYCPTEMNYRILVEKLSSKKRNISSYVRSRSLSDTIKEPAKKLISNSSSIYKRSRSTGSENADQTDNSLSNNSNIGEQTTFLDVSRSRESIYLDVNCNMDISFSSNIWYYGQLNMQFIKSNDESATFSTSILARVDKYGDVMYSLTYDNEDDLCTGAFPFDGNRYCLDFFDPSQPRFISVKYLLAYLIEQKVLQRVSFSWLIDNCNN